MAIDLTSSLSPFEYQNMLPLDLLADVASKTQRNEIPSTDAPENNSPNNAKKQLKKSDPCVLTLDDIRALPVKSLVDKFSEMVSDEYNRKYHYKCFLLPEQCTMSFHSFGNEKQACDKIKSHLLSHVQHLLSEQEANKEISEILFVPRSPNLTSKHTEKLSKKSMKKQPISPNQVLPRANFKTSKKEKNDELVAKKAKKNTELAVKKVKKKLHASKKGVTELKNGFGKDKSKLFNSVYLEKNACNTDFSDDSFHSDPELNAKTVDEESIKERDVGWKSEFNSDYSKHLKYIFFSNDAAKEKLSESDSEHDSNDFDNFPEENNSSAATTDTNSARSYMSFTFLEDHNYANSEGNKADKLLSSECKTFPRKYEDPFLLQTNAQTHLIIRTPPFPFVHTPLLPEVAEIMEIGEVECFCGAEECSRFTSSSPDTSIVKSEPEEMLTDELVSDHEKYSASVFYKMNGAGSSVLECVDNIVNKKQSNSCVPKNEISANENDENLENRHKFEKELALKYIAKLHSKGKKKIPDSLICQICPDKQFTAQATLIHHYRSHAGIKPYVCEICAAKFTRQHSLNYHILIHENRSRFTCEFCARTFRHPSHYKEHLRRHTGETPYHCTDCNLHFKTRNTFKRHLKTRHAKLLTAGGIEDLNAE